MRRRRPELLTASAVLVVLAGLALRATAAEPSPTPTRTPEPKSLADVVRQAQQRQGGGPKPASTPIVISNANLAEYAAKGVLTEAKGSPANQGTTLSGASPAAGASAESADEQSKRNYWRNRYQQQKQNVEAMRAEIDRLDSEIPGLWFDFYRWDDPVYRDTVIKPRLDESLVRRDDLAAQLPEQEALVPEILDQARKDGALPGWFRDLE